MICESTTKSFRNSSTLSEMIPQLQIIMFNTLCRVSLDMRDSEYLRLLGYKTESYKTFAPVKPAGANSLVVLTRTVSIEYLSFDFRTSPYPSVPAQVDTPLQL